jgi:hypothetical protein
MCIRPTASEVLMYGRGLAACLISHHDSLPIATAESSKWQPCRNRLESTPNGAYSEPAGRSASTGGTPLSMRGYISLTRAPKIACKAGALPAELWPQNPKYTHSRQPRPLREVGDALRSISNQIMAAPSSPVCSSSHRSASSSSNSEM